LFSYRPNIDAARFFLVDIFPLIKRELPDCRVIFAGRQASEAFGELDCPLGVEIVADPEDMRFQFDRAWIFVAPLRMGGGTRLKILEAMAMECPVVSTRIGSAGLPVEVGKHLLLEDEPRRFADAVIGLVRDEEQRKGIAKNALQLVRNCFDWSSVAREGVRNVARAVSKCEPP
jgi:glycosyltransferase involved in cell wall biosynthesis